MWLKLTSNEKVVKYISSTPVRLPENPVGKIGIADASRQTNGKKMMMRLMLPYLLPRRKAKERKKIRLNLSDNGRNILKVANIMPH